MSFVDDERVGVAEHECPLPLRARADEFGAGGMVWSPACRWETVRETRYTSMDLIVVTDRATWKFWRSTELPYLPPYEAQPMRPAQIVVDETDSTMAAEVRSSSVKRHGLITAARGRGGMWIIFDRPDGEHADEVVVEGRAKARTELRRRARAHGKRLGLPVEVVERGRR